MINILLGAALGALGGALFDRTKQPKKETKLPEIIVDEKEETGKDDFTAAIEAANSTEPTEKEN